jgi:hypothetical protein
MLFISMIRVYIIHFSSSHFVVPGNIDTSHTEEIGSYPHTPRGAVGPMFGGGGGGTGSTFPTNPNEEKIFWTTTFFPDNNITMAFVALFPDFRSTFSDASP